VGMITVALELARAMVMNRDGDTFTLLCSRERPPALADLDCEAVLAPYRHEVVLKTRWLPMVEPQLGSNAILYPYWPSPPRRRHGAPPAAVVVNDLAFRLRPAEVPWQQRAYFGTVLGPALRQAAAVVVPTETTRRDLLAAYPVAGLDERVTVIPYGFRALAAAGSLPDGIQPGFILAVGTIEPRKNYPRLLAAYRRLRSKPGAVPIVIGTRAGGPQLVIAGRPGWAYGDTLDRINSEPGVRYLGHVDEPTLAALYENASVLALPSLYEGFGLPLLEAMARGVPAVIGKTGALPELAGGTAIEVDPEDVEAIAGALERVLSDAALRKMLGEGGKKRAAAFTWDRAAAETVEVLRRIGAAG
jgi:glycosyltransferase involved in cell wall biosynthesis